MKHRIPGVRSINEIMRHGIPCCMDFHKHILAEEKNRKRERERLRRIRFRRRK
jgi:hypothetical protein